MEKPNLCRYLAYAACFPASDASYITPRFGIECNQSTAVVVSYFRNLQTLGGDLDTRQIAILHGASRLAKATWQQTEPEIEARRAYRRRLYAAAIGAGVLVHEQKKVVRF